MKASPPLFHRYLDGQASADEVTRLSELLRADEAARQEFAELANLDSALGALAADWVSAPAAKRIVAFPRSALWLAAAACVAIVAGGTWWWALAQRPFATVANAIGIADLVNGAALRNESHDIGAGTVEFLTARGARVVIEAPASFRFESAQRLRMIYGRVAAEVPPAAKGFTVVTPTGNAIDLGTKFGVDVPRQGAAEVHVFQGAVITQPKGSGTRRNLHDGEAIALQTSGDTSREMRSAAFIRPEEMSSLSAALTGGQRARSDAAVATLRRDPALIVLVDFESADLPQDNFRIVQGRWPGSHAAEFVNVGDRMKLDVGGEHTWPQLTMAAWVRIDRLGEPYQSLYHTDGWNDDKPGQVHWMILRETTMRFALRQNKLPSPPNPRNAYPDSHLPVLPERGRWVHLAVVYDSTARIVRFYLNGEFDNETQLEVAHPARLGPAQIGNWSSKDRKLSGRVDEMILLGRAMTDAEVRALFAAGNPYR